MGTASIRVRSGIKRIEVNDDGEYIEINFGDARFMGNLFNMLNDAQAKVKEAEAKEAEIREQFKDDTDAQTRELLELNQEVLLYMVTGFDSVLGAGTCNKVFGDIIPTVYLFQDFMDQLLPILEEGQREQEQRQMKYSPNRRGNA